MKKINFKSIKTKIISLFVATILVLVSIVGFMVYQKSDKLLTESFTKTADVVLISTDSMITTYLRGLEKQVLLTVKDKDVINSIKELDSSSLKIKGKYMQGSSLPSMSKGVAKFEEFAKLNDGETILVYYGTAKDNFISYPECDLPGDYTPTTRTWYKDSISKDKFIWTDPYIDEVTGNLLVSGAYPIKDGSKVIGVMGIDVNLDILMAGMKDIKPTESGYVIIAGPGKEILYHPTKELVGKVIGKDTEVKIEELTNAIENKNTEIFNYKMDNDGKIAKIKFNELGWSLITVTVEKEFAQQSASLLSTIVGVSSFLTIGAIFVVVLFSNYLAKNIIKLNKAVDDIKDGKLNTRVKIDSKDEIGKLGNGVNEMAIKVSELIKEIKGASSDLTISSQNLAAIAQETNASTEEVSRSMEEIAKGAGEQASYSEKGVGLANQLSEKLTELLQNSESMLKAAEYVNTKNDQGISTVKELQEKTKQSNIATEKIRISIQELNEKTSNIETIIETIAQIAEQTNLLALNAAIEAARAGEHGKGFSVVADEVKKLAEQSSKSASEIKNIISNIQRDVRNSVNAMGEVQSIVEAQTKSTNEVDVAFAEISNATKEINSKINDTNNSVVQLNKDKEEILESMTNISAVSEETAASSEEVSATMQQQTASVEQVSRSANDLSDLSNKLTDEINKFEI